VDENENSVNRWHKAQFAGVLSR